MPRPRKTVLWAALLRAVAEHGFSLDIEAENFPVKEFMTKASVPADEYETVKKIWHHPDFRKAAKAIQLLPSAAFNALLTNLQSDKPSMQAVDKALWLTGGIEANPPTRANNTLEVSGGITLAPAQLPTIGSLTDAQRRELLAQRQRLLVAPEPQDDPDIIDADYTEQ